MDVYDPSLGGAQIRDLNPGIEQSGLFWTAVVPVEAVAANFAAGTAMVQMSDYHLKDYHDLQNGIFGGGPNPVPATLSFRAKWNCPAAGGTANIAAQKYRGTVKVGTAQMEWSARIGDMLYQSFPIGSSTSDFAELVQESNGTFY